MFLKNNQEKSSKRGENHYKSISLYVSLSVFSASAESFDDVTCATIRCVVFLKTYFQNPKIQQ